MSYDSVFSVFSVVHRPAWHEDPRLPRGTLIAALVRAKEVTR
jgi:hypothetical protein